MRQIFVVKKWARVRRWLLRGLIAVIVLVTAAWWFENWRGARAWEEAKARAEAVGVSLNRADYAGPAIPNEENLLLNPVFAAELEKEEGERLGVWKEQLQEFFVGFDLNPETGESFQLRDYFTEEITEEEALKKVVELAEDDESRIDSIVGAIQQAGPGLLLGRADATAELMEVGEVALQVPALSNAIADSILIAFRSGNAEKALDRLEAIDRLRRMLEGPSMVSSVVSMGILGRELTMVWEGLRLKVWSSSQLAQLTEMLDQVDLYRVMESTICFETSFVVEALSDLSRGQTHGYEPANFSEWTLRYGPEGRVVREMARMVEGYLGLVEALHSKKEVEVLEFWESFKQADLDESALSSQAVSMMLGIIESVIGPTADEISLAKLNLAAERYLIENGKYPDTLGEIGDEIDLRNVDYRLAPDGRPRISIESRYGDEEASMHWQFSPDESAPE